jgi:hypothetical protein
MATMKWKKVHSASGATAFQTKTKGCKLRVSPRDWSKPRGEAIWSVTCGSARSPDFFHKRGSRKTVKDAKAAARRVAGRRKR